jgi:hypothetical protein
MNSHFTTVRYRRLQSSTQCPKMYTHFINTYIKYSGQTLINCYVAFFNISNAWNAHKQHQRNFDNIQKKVVVPLLFIVGAIWVYMVPSVHCCLQYPTIKGLWVLSLEIKVDTLPFFTILLIFQKTIIDKISLANVLIRLSTTMLKKKTLQKTLVDGTVTVFSSRACQ